MAVALSTIRAEALELVHKTGSTFATPAQVDAWINLGIGEMWGTIARVNPNHLLDTYDFTLSGSTNSVALTAVTTRPRMIYGIERDPTSTNRYWLKPGTAMMKNADSSLHGTRRRLTFRRTRLSIFVDPVENAPGDYRLYYVGTPVALSADGDNIDVALEPWWHMAAQYAAIRIKDKEEVSRNNDVLDQTLRLMQQLEDEVMAASSAVPMTMTDVDDLGEPGRW